ncbi:MAG: CHAT domain-containing protein [Geitlerinemataceae cyanobacterium]
MTAQFFLKGLLIVIVTSCWIPDRGLANSELETLPSALNLEREAQQLYESGRFDEAVLLLQQLSKTASENGDPIGQAIALRNLALVYQKTGDLATALETIADSFNLLESLQSNRQTQRIVAEALEVRGQIELDAGGSETAIETWRQAKLIYQDLDDIRGLTRTQISLAQGLKSLGLYNQAIDTLTQVSNPLQTQPDTVRKAQVLRSLGDALRVVGDLKRSEKLLRQSLQIAQQLSASEEIAALFISLGNTVRSQPDRLEVAIELYQQAIVASSSPQLQSQAQLNQLSLLLEINKTIDAENLVAQIEENLSQLPLNKETIYAKINLAKSLLKLDDSTQPNDRQAAELLATSIREAQILNDRRTESYALGNLGKLYEKRQQWEEAKELTEKALLLAQSTNSTDIAYQWQWQLGRILKIKNDRSGAIASYSQAVESLKSIRSDLVVISSDVQFSFRQSVEPVYREFVSLLLQPNINVTQHDLMLARQTIESLQLAELDNFFRDACLDAKPAQIDRVDANAAVLYSIILNDRLEVVAAIPGQPLQHYTTTFPKEEVEVTIKNTLNAILSPRQRRDINNFLQPSQKLYDWLIRPIEADLANSSVNTLVFVSDGLLRRLPMSALYDGNEYLVQKYAVALAPGLQLVESQPIAETKFQVLTGGLSEARQGFAALPGVESELDKIRSEVPVQGVFNQAFTEENVRELLNSSSFPIVHLATHGEFSSNSEDTFILTWDDRINANELESFLKSQSQRGETIELLVLSACRTAAGDDRAALGLAGVAVRAGARSTIASLWYISDAATSILMSQLYVELAKGTETKAKALRLAQQSVLQNEDFSHPYFWAAFVLVGNWL